MRDGKFSYWECENCGCTKQKDWGLPWFYFVDGQEYPVFKSPKCAAKKYY